MHQEVKTNIKVIKLINGDDIVCHLPEKDKQLPDNSPLLRLDRPLQIKYVPQITSNNENSGGNISNWLSKHIFYMPSTTSLMYVHM